MYAVRDSKIKNKYTLTKNLHTNRYLKLFKKLYKTYVKVS